MLRQTGAGLTRVDTLLLCLGLHIPHVVSSGQTLLQGGALLPCSRQQGHVHLEVRYASKTGSNITEQVNMPEACSLQHQNLWWQALGGRLLLACCRLHKTRATMVAMHSQVTLSLTGSSRSKSSQLLPQRQQLA